MASAREESSCLKSGTITDCSLPLSQNISYLFYTPFSCSPYHLFVTCFFFSFHFPPRREKQFLCVKDGVDNSLIRPPLFVFLFFVSLSLTSASPPPLSLLLFLLLSSPTLPRGSWEVHRLMGEDDICSVCVPALLWPFVINHSH